MTALKNKAIQLVETDGSTLEDKIFALRNVCLCVGPTMLYKLETLSLILCMLFTICMKKTLIQSQAHAITNTEQGDDNIK